MMTLPDRERSLTISPIRHNTNINRQTDGRTDGRTKCHSSIACQIMTRDIIKLYELPEEAIMQVVPLHSVNVKRDNQ